VAYGNVFFRVKMAMLALAGLNAWLFHAGIYRSPPQWEHQVVPPARVRMTGSVSLTLWACIVLAGRLIAYNWFEPQ
jgi:hypothetical protein